MPDENDIWVPYVICGGAIVVSGLVYAFLYHKNVLSLLQHKNTDKNIVDQRKERSLSDVWMFFLTVFATLYASESIEIVFNAQIYTYARCSGFTVTDAARLNSLYWTAVAVSRFGAIFLANRLTPPVYLSIAIVVCSIGTAILYCNMLWIAAVVIGLSVALYAPCGISFAASWTKMSGRYIGLFGIAHTRFAYDNVIAVLLHGRLLLKKSLVSVCGDVNYFLSQISL